MFTLYHYTNFAGLYGMLKDFDSEKHPYLTMWATNASFMNDSSEFSFGKEICMKAVSEYETQLGIATDDCIINGYNYDGMTRKKKMNATPCIVSFSTTVNNASMWEMYSMGGTGIAIKLDKEELAHIDDFTALSPCIYCSSYCDLLEQNKIVEKFYSQSCNINYDGPLNNEIMRFGKAYALIMNLAPRIKHSAYKFEDEYRLIRYGEDTPLFRVRKDIIIPYKEVLVPIEAVQGFVIGPTANFDYIYSSLETFLASKGLSSLDQYIVKSEVPYRG